MNTTSLSLILSALFLILESTPVYAGKITFESDVKVKKTEQSNFEDLKAGDSFTLNSGDQVFAITKQGLPLLIFSPSSKNSNLVVQSVSLNAAMTEQLQPTLNKATNEVIDGLRKAESFMQKRDYTQATTVTNQLKQKYGNISSVLFLSGTLNFLMNNKSTAIEDLQKGLAIDPSNEAAKKLLSQLKGGT